MRVLLFIIIEIYLINLLAFSVGTGFTDPCHERFTSASYSISKFDLPVNKIIIPDDKIWPKLMDSIEDDIMILYSLESERYYFFSLFVGVRSNDSDGHSVLNIKALRSLHLNPEGQYDHFLRSPYDDYTAGDTNAVEKSRKSIEDFLSRAEEYSKKSIDEQIIEVNYYLEFYGRIKVKVWAPAFYLGKALHTLHDSFSHTLRSDNMRKILHVLNYSDALNDDWVEKRDGLRHSTSMDQCNSETSDLINATLEASVDFLYAVYSYDENSFKGVDLVLDKWLTLKQNCDYSNNYCNALWADKARKDPTRPIIDEAFSVLGCSMFFIDN